jgi:uncharacterized Zn finger protein
MKLNARLIGSMVAVYQVRVGRHPHCTCPDAAKGNLCKHYLYVMIRVLRLDQNDPIVWQRALLTSEAEEVAVLLKLSASDATV